MKTKRFRKILIFSAALAAVFIFSANAYARDLKIIRIKGKVLLREEEDKSWRRAKKGEPLYDNYELLTKRRSECTFSFGDDVNKALTLKQNSQLKLTDVNIGRLLLSQGRIFSLMEKMDKKSTFEIRTPVAIAGVRGTGWTVESDRQTSVRCFEGEVYVKGLDEEGNVISDKDIEQDSGVKVSKRGEIDEPFALTKKDKKEWQGFKNILKKIGKSLGKAAVAVGGITDGALDGYLGDADENPYNR